MYKTHEDKLLIWMKGWLGECVIWKWCDSICRSSSVGVIETSNCETVQHLLLLKLKTSVMIKQFCVWIHLRKVIFSRLRCDPAWTWLAMTHQTVVGFWSSHWDQFVCWCSDIFINSLCFSVALISWSRGAWGMNTRLHGWIIYLSGAEGHSMAVRAGIGWYSQRCRDLQLYIPDLLTCLSIHVWFGGPDALSGRFQRSQSSISTLSFWKDSTELVSLAV